MPFVPATAGGKVIITGTGRPLRPALFTLHGGPTMTGLQAIAKRLDALSVELEALRTAVRRELDRDLARARVRSQYVTLVDVHVRLPLRPRQVLELLLEGLSEKQIAIVMGLSPHTVHYYTKLLHKAFNVCARSELLALFLRRRDAMDRSVAVLPGPARSGRLPLRFTAAESGRVLSESPSTREGDPAAGGLNRSASSP